MFLAYGRDRNNLIYVSQVPQIGGQGNLIEFKEAIDLAGG